MKLIVNPHKIVLDKEEAVNEKEINISKCTFEFSEEITEDYVKEAYFTFKGNAYKKIIVNDECTIPQEVLQEEGTVEVGVVAYLVEDETEIKRYNPSPIWFKTDKGSLKQAQNSQEPTPSEMEQYEQALQDGLTLVNEKLGDVDTAITQANNLNLDANKVGTTTTVEITKKNGTTKTVNILDGEQGPQGIQGPQGPQGPAGKDGVDGKDGINGTNGQDGFSPSASVTKSGSVATITITDKNSTTTATISDGTNGQDGQDGVGVPSGGTQGQVLAKNSGTNYDTTWVDLPEASESNYLGYTDNFNSSNRLDVTNLELGVYTLGVTRLNTAPTLYLKYMYNGVEKTVDYQISYSGIIVDCMIYIWVRNKISTMTTADETFEIYYLGMNNMYKEIKRYAHGADYYPSTGTLSLYTLNTRTITYQITTQDTDQTISGKKTFTTLPESSVVPTTNDQLVNKKYVDDNAGGSSIPIYAFKTSSLFSTSMSYFDSTDVTAMQTLINSIYSADAGMFSILLSIKATNSTYPQYYQFLLKPLSTIELKNKPTIIYLSGWGNNDTIFTSTAIVKLGVTIELTWSDDTCTISSIAYRGWAASLGLLETTQTFTGTKTFSVLPKCSATPSSDNQLVNKSYVDGLASPTVTTSATSTYTIASLTGNKVYKLGEITDLTITAITTFDKESTIYFESGSTATDISIPDTLTNLGDVPTLTASGGVNTGTCEASKNYIISVLNNIAIWKNY